MGTLPWDELPWARGARIIARDEQGLMALFKPAGVLSHPNSDRDVARAILAVPYELKQESYRFSQPVAGRLWLLNRLDSATSGVLLATTNPAVAVAVRSAFRQRRVHKIYQALVFGRPRSAEQDWRDPLDVQKRAGRIRTAVGNGSLRSESRMRLVRTTTGDPTLSLLELEPRTGRSHQLRVQCARRGLPIVGDQTYGEFKRNREFAKRFGTKRLFLHSLATELEYELDGHRHRFAARAPLPEEFALATEHGINPE